MPTPMAATYPSDTPGLRAHRACRNCVQIKAKCVPLEGSNNTTCQRCHRLKKECTTPVPVPRKRRNKSTRVSQLEQRLDTLTSLLTTRGGANEIPDPPNPSLPTPPVSSTNERRSLNDFNHGPDPDAWVNPCKAPPIKQTLREEADEFFHTPLAPVMEEKLFSHFRTEMSQYFPFVVVPPDATAVAFKEGKPFLFRCCVTAACHPDPHVQRQLVEELLRYLGDRMLLNSERSLDLLQGVLVLIAWYQFYNHYNPQLMNLLHLASALVIDLGLNRPCHSGPWPPVGMVTEVTQLIHGGPVMQGAHTSDERRAVLGVCYFTGKISSCFRRLDPVRWTPHLEDCCNSLLAAAEYPTDVYAVQFVQLYRITERYSPYLATRSYAEVPIRTYVRCFEEDIEKYQQRLPPDLAKNALMRMHILSAQIGLYEAVVNAECDAPIQRAEALHACLQRVKSLYDVLDGQPPDSLPNLPFLAWIHVVHALIVVAKLSFLVADGWDLQYVRTSPVNFESVLDCLITKLESVAQHNLREFRTPNAVSARFMLYAEKTRVWKRWYENKIKVEAAPHTSQPPDIGGAVLPMDDQVIEGFLDGFDDGAWQDFIGDWTANFQF
ncbi:uncharacterized protein Z518_08393 [Rhinocladiella mackenziei CBS 650.93]|uniref:Zn(2)-C6 fungal-type domain-containing protein n=1 Tax=Rhinocladiella mackenziei CBS 650.93 TaxID=1442369 RepID=A0A0D2FKI8_9EURO|nr:uncharacterized protein Z518_08393 [Rhinocladiella mackenziei CBS 650.93]KIX02452.1 hypothetical protein Z518_08393 [Rhinocladiella mackenziei CBS 650.93]